MIHYTDCEGLQQDIRKDLILPSNTNKDIISTQEEVSSFLFGIIPNPFQF